MYNTVWYSGCNSSWYTNSVSIGVLFSESVQITLTSTLFPCYEKCRLRTSKEGIVAATVMIVITTKCEQLSIQVASHSTTAFFNSLVPLSTYPRDKSTTQAKKVQNWIREGALVGKGKTNYLVTVHQPCLIPFKLFFFQELQNYYYRLFARRSQEIHGSSIGL